MTTGWAAPMMLELLKEELPLDVTFAFTAQEEVGTRGPFGRRLLGDAGGGLVLETTTAADLPRVEEHRKVCAPRKGAGDLLYGRRHHL